MVTGARGSAKPSSSARRVPVAAARLIIVGVFKRHFAPGGIGTVGRYRALPIRIFPAMTGIGTEPLARAYTNGRNRRA